MDARTRLGWVKSYEQLGNAGVVCRRCGISRPTLRKWWHRYQAQAQGEAGLESRSRQPHHSPNRRWPARPVTQMEPPGFAELGTGNQSWRSVSRTVEASPSAP